MTRLFRNRWGLNVSFAYPGTLGYDFPDPPPGFVYLVDDEGTYITDDNGVFLVVEF